MKYLELAKQHKQFCQAMALLFGGIVGVAIVIFFIIQPPGKKLTTDIKEHKIIAKYVLNPGSNYDTKDIIAVYEKDGSKYEFRYRQKPGEDRANIIMEYDNKLMPVERR